MKLWHGRLKRKVFKELYYNKRNVMYCGCGNLVEEGRREIGLKCCRACAFTGPDVPRPKGYMSYAHKTGAEIQILSAESWSDQKKYIIPNNRSCVKNFSKNVCS